MAAVPEMRLGAPPRSFAADAHDRIMVRVQRTHRIQGCGAMCRARRQAPPRTGENHRKDTKDERRLERLDLTTGSPYKVKASFGSRLFELQQGRTPLGMKPLTQFGTGVYELRESFDRNAYRLMYVVNLSKALYVLHAFMKKSKSGVGLPKPDAELIELRLRRARELDAEG